MAKLDLPLETIFAADLRKANVPFVQEYKAIPGRKYRWDFHIPDTDLLIELNGATWTKGGHSTGSGIQRDYTKANLAIIYGWRQLTFTAQDVQDGTALDTVCKVLLGGER